MDAALRGRIRMGLLCFRPAHRCLATVPQLDRKRGASSPVQAPQQPEEGALGRGSRRKRPLKHELLSLGFVLPASDTDGYGEELMRRRRLRGAERAPSSSSTSGTGSSPLCRCLTQMRCRRQMRRG